MNQQQIQISLTNNQTVPAEGPKCIPLVVNFQTPANSEQDLDLLLTEQQGYMTMIQTVFIDMSGSANTLSIVIKGSNQVIVAKAHTQGYYPVLCPNPSGFRFLLSNGGAPATGDLVPVFLINVPIAGVQWASQ